MFCAAFFCTYHPATIYNNITPCNQPKAVHQVLQAFLCIALVRAVAVVL